MCANTFLSKKPRRTLSGCLEASRRAVRKKTGGFALLITITLLAFLVLLLVSLASLTRVETQVASNSQQLSQARQNALMALNLAVGELQRMAGADRRVTATANLGNGSNGIATPNDGTRYWTGVWGESAKTVANVPAPTLLGWLVSGNEGQTVSQDTTALDYGRITSAAATPKFIPSQTVGGLSVNSTALTATVTVNSGKTPAVVLAGPNTVGTTAADLSGYVVAPLVEINAPAGALPGQGAGATPPIGRYAWWVGDEGVKARVNLVDPLSPHPASTDGSLAAFSPTTAQQQLRLLAAQRVGGEGITEGSTALTDFATVQANTVAGADARARLLRAITPGQLPLFDSGITSTAVRSGFHDMTTLSAGVLSDTARGGLRADLTQLFNASNAASFLTGLQSYFGRTLTAGVPVVDDLNRDGLFNNTSDLWANGPTWEQLWSFYSMGNAPTATPAGVMTVNSAGVMTATPRGQTATQHGIGPVVVESRIYWGITVRNTAPDTNAVDVLIRPAFVLANPYTVPLAACTYTVTVDMTYGPRIGWWITGDTSYRWSNLGQFQLNSMRFQLQSQGLAPGESRVFTLKYKDANWNASAYNYPSSGDRSATTPNTFILTNDWDGGLAHIVVGTGTGGGTGTVTNAELAQGINTSFGFDPSPKGGYSGGEFSLTLWGPDGLRLQRIERMGFPGYNYSGPNPVVTAVSSRNWQGGFTLRRSGVNEMPTDNIIQGYNWRAVLLTRELTTSGVPPGYSLGHWTPSARFAGNMLLDATPGSPTLGQAYWAKISQGSSGVNNTLSGQGDERLNACFFDVPAATGPLVSLGQLQHFNASGNVDGYTQTLGSPPSGGAAAATASMLGLAVAPAYAVGNSRASPYIARSAWSSTANQRIVYDASWLLNRTLWDRYFFSTVPQSGPFDFATGLLSNPRLRPFRANLASTKVGAYSATPVAAAANLLNLGAFNVNSTSIEAWTALFTSLNGIPYPGTATGLSGAFARSVRQIGGNANAADGVSADAWSGYRNLTSTEISTLATKMVDQVRLRGPFVSLADFVNRRLDSSAKGLEGALAAAIAAAGLNIGTSTATYGAQPAGNTPPMVDTTNIEPAQVAGVPGWLTQADLLQALGPTLAARSDTFVIRTYGEVLDPVNSTAANPIVVGRAWLEAVVQRQPDYVDAANTVDQRATALTSTNGNFGRKFVIVSYRWLGPGDI